MIKLSGLTQNLAVNTITGLISSSFAGKATSPGTMQIWGGIQPANANLPPSGLLMASLPFGAPPFNSPETPGVTTAVIKNPNPKLPDFLQGEIQAGIMSWFRILDGGGNTVVDGAITNTSGNGDLKVTNVNVSAGTFVVSSYTLTMPASFQTGTGTFRISAATMNTIVDAITKSMNGPGAKVGLMKIYTGPQPDSADTPPTGTLLAVLAFSTQAYQEAGIVDFGYAVNNLISGSGQVIANGLMGWFRIQGGDGFTILDGSVGQSGQDLNFDTCSVNIGGNVVISSLPFIIPQAALATAATFSPQPPSHISVGAAFSVGVLFATSNTKPVVGVTLALHISSGTLQGNTLATTNSAGLATFGGLSDNTPGTYTLDAEFNGVILATSNAFSVVPVVASVNPNFGTTLGGTNVTITGQGFANATAVSFGGTPAASMTIISDTQITAVSPAQSPSVVDVTVSAGGVTSLTHAGDKFTF